MCEYLLEYDKSVDGDGNTDWASLEAAIMVAEELYPEARRED